MCPAEQETPPIPVLRLLLIEDSVDDADLILLTVRAGGFALMHQRVDTEEDLKTALAGKTWDLVISDFHMPRLTATLALSIVREHSTDLPFIIVSGSIGEESAVEAMRAGANDYLMKDKLLRLVPAIRRELGEARNRFSLREKESQLLQAQKMEALGRLAGGVAHDFNNILVVILLYCDMLLERHSEHEQTHKDILEICNAANRSQALTSQLLALSRRQVLETRVIDLGGIVRNTEKILSRMIGDDIQLTTEISDSGGRVKVDPGQIGQVLMNLAVNARDAMPQGGKLTIATRPKSIDGKHYITLEVADTGTGIAPEVQKSIFEPFFTTKSPDKGTGLGLSTVYGIVKQSGGQIEVRSELGRGSVFTVLLPEVNLPPDPGIRTQSRPAPETEKALRTILVVDDDPSIGDIVCRTLEAQGYGVLRASSPEEALRRAEQSQRQIDLLLTDIVMPNTNGPTLARRLMTLSPGLRVLFMSGYFDETLEQHGFAAESMLLIRKPFSSAVLLEKVEEALSEPVQ